jgi:hypothetical protein
MLQFQKRESTMNELTRRDFVRGGLPEIEWLNILPFRLKQRKHHPGSQRQHLPQPSNPKSKISARIGPIVEAATQ